MSSNLSDYVGGAPAKWVTGTTYAAGKVVWSPADYQYYMRKTAGAGATDPASDPANWQPTGARAIKSIQRGVAMNAGGITISAVNPAKTELRLLGGVSNDYSSVAGLPTIFLSSPTTITVGNVPSYCNFSWELTERY